MKNTIFFDSDFNFTLLENEENPDNSIYIKFHTSDAANQVLNILANGQTITENLASDDDIEYELEQTNWTDNGATAVWLTNDNITSPKVKIIFSEIPTVSCAINRGTNTVFIMRYEGQNEEESGSGSGGGSGSNSGFDFVETIRNIGFRLLDEPSNVSAVYNQAINTIEIKWTDPADILTNEPTPAQWAGTVVVRKSGSAPLHKWDGTIVVDSTTRDEYSVNALVDNNITEYATYYYGIFPYFVALDDADNPIKHYRYTKTVMVSTFINDEIEFSYTGEIQTFTALKDGVYKLEAWGAQGGTADDEENTTASGGFGSYSVGEVELHQGDTLYIGVGGQGGYNGGGAGNGDPVICYIGAEVEKMYINGELPVTDIIGTGGGATHIAKVTGELSALSSNLSDVLIVAGGGGGGLVSSGTAIVGANGGGISGSGNNSADQTTGFAFGQGEAGGGGAGLYGGYKAANGDSGGGGSGYIGNALLDAKKMIGYNVPTSDVASTKTESVNIYSQTAEENTPKAGNGFAKITWLRDLPPAPQTALYEWDFTESLIDKVQGEEITLTNATRDANGIHFDYQNDVANIPTNLLQVGRKYEIYFGAFNISDPSVGNRRMFSFGSSYAEGFHYRGTSGKWATWDTVNYWQESGISARGYFENSVLTIEITADSKWHFYKDGTLFFEPSQAIALNQNTFALGAGQDGAYFMTITAFKIYELTE